MSAYMLKFAELARDALSGLRPALAMLDSAAPGALQRVKVAAQLAAKVSELVAMTGPSMGGGPRLAMNRARLAREILELLARLNAPPPAPDITPPDPLVQHQQDLADVADGRHDGMVLLNLWSLIHQAVEVLTDGDALTGENETLAHRAITRWAELEEQTNG